MSLDPIKIARQILIDGEIVTLPSESEDWPCYDKRLPDDASVPNNALAIVGTSGVKQGRKMRGLTLMKRGVQVFLRSSKYDDGWDKMVEIQAEFDTVDKTTVTVDSVDYLVQVMVQVTDIISIGTEPDNSRRELFSLNYLMEVKTS